MRKKGEGEKRTPELLRIKKPSGRQAMAPWLGQLSAMLPPPSLLNRQQSQCFECAINSTFGLRFAKPSIATVHEFLLKSMDSLRCEGLGFKVGSAIGWDEYKMKRADFMDEYFISSLAEKKTKVSIRADFPFSHKVRRCYLVPFSSSPTSYNKTYVALANLRWNIYKNYVENWTSSYSFMIIGSSCLLIS